jgi:hypothetical protein
MRPEPGVFVLKDDTTLVSMKTASFASEDDFQRLLALFPQLLAGDQINIDMPRRFMLVAREAGIGDDESGTSRWSIDHLFLDQDGVPTFVEVKRSTDTRIRREVVGQMLDYAANAIRYWPAEELRRLFQQRCDLDGADPADVLATVLGHDADDDTYWNLVRTNLQAGRIRMLFVADRIPPELRRVVEFLNEQMQPAEVLAVELRQYEGEGLKTLVPIIIGQRQTAIQKKAVSASRSKTDWDEDSFLAELARRSPGALDAAKVILSWMRANADQVELKQANVYPSYECMFISNGAEIRPFRLWADGQFSIQCQNMIGKPIFDQLELRQELVTRLNQITGVNLPADAASKRRVVKTDALNGQTVEMLTACLDWWVEKLHPPL